MDKQSILGRLHELYADYGGLTKNQEPQKPVAEEYRPVIGDLLSILLYLDQQAKNVIMLADMAVQEAREIEAAVLSTKEGREFVDHLMFIRPELFPVRNKRTLHGNA